MIDTLAATPQELQQEIDQLNDHVDTLEEALVDVRDDYDNERREREEIESEYQSAIETLEKAPKAIREAIEITSLRGPAEGMQWLIHWLHGDENPTDVDLSHLAYDWLSRWEVTER